MSPHPPPQGPAGSVGSVRRGRILAPASGPTEALDRGTSSGPKGWMRGWPRGKPCPRDPETPKVPQEGGETTREGAARWAQGLGAWRGPPTPLPLPPSGHSPGFCDPLRWRGWGDDQRWQGWGDDQIWVHRCFWKMSLWLWGKGRAQEAFQQEGTSEQTRINLLPKLPLMTGGKRE